MDKNLISRLDETVKSTLNKYEAPLNTADWARMESMLDAAPNNNSLRRSNSPAILVAFVVLAVGFILYFVLKPSGDSVNVEETKVETKVAKPTVNKPKPAIAHTVAVNPVTPTIKKVAVPIVKKDTVAVSKRIVKQEKDIKKDIKSLEKKPVDKAIVKKTSVESTEKKDKVVTTRKKESKTAITNETSTEDILDVELDADDLRLEKALKKEALAKKEAQLKKEKALAKKEALKKEKAAKKLVKPVISSQGNDTVHIDDENDSNRKSLKVIESTPVENKVDTSKISPVKTKAGTVKKKSKKDRKLVEKDSVIEKK